MSTLISNDGQAVLRTDAEKGFDSIEVTAATGQHTVLTLGSKGISSTDTLGSTEAADRLDTIVETPAPAWTMPTATFRARQAFLALTPTERQAVATRPRFYRLPWLKLADDADDVLP